MRALAVLFVVADHVLETTGEVLQRSYHPYDHYLGRLGVLVFFVHTSLVLMLSMDRSRVVGLPFFTSFYARRAFRIYPLSIVCVLLMLALDAPPVAWATEAAPAFSAFSIAANLALVQNLVNAPLVLSPLWSLPLELQMYAVLPFIHRQLRRGNAVRTVWLLWALTVAFAIVQPLIHGLGRLTVARFGPCFLAGVLAYVLLRRETPRWPALAWAGLLGAATLGYIAVALVSPSVHPAWLGWAFCLTLGLGIPTFRQIRSPWLRRASHSVAQVLVRGVSVPHAGAVDWVRPDRPLGARSGCRSSGHARPSGGGPGAVLPPDRAADDRRGHPSRRPPGSSARSRLVARASRSGSWYRFTPMPLARLTHEWLTFGREPIDVRANRDAGPGLGLPADQLIVDQLRRQHADDRHVVGVRELPDVGPGPALPDQLLHQRRGEHAQPRAPRDRMTTSSIHSAPGAGERQRVRGAVRLLRAGQDRRPAPAPRPRA